MIIASMACRCCRQPSGLTALRDAAGEYFGSDTVEIANLQYREAMILPDSGERIVQSILTPLDDSTAEFRFASIGANGADDWRTHMVGVARKQGAARSASTVPFELDHVRQRCADSIPVERYYESLRALGLEYGGSFRGIEMLQRGTGEVLTRVRLPAHLSVDGQSGLHPALLDACLHLYPALVDAYGDFTQAANGLRRTYLPISVERFRCAAGSVPGRFGCMARDGNRENGNSEIFTTDIAIYQDDGRFAAAIEGLSLKPLPPEALRPPVAKGASSVDQTASPTMRGERRGPDAAAIRSQLTEASGTERRELLVSFVRQEAMKTLGITETIDAARPLGELGLDSLMSVTLLNRLEAALGIKVSAVKLIQGPSVEQIADDILTELPAANDASRPQPIMAEPGHSAGSSIAAGVVAEDDEAGRQPIVTPAKHSAGSWLVIVGPKTAPRLRLFCFPFAGGARRFIGTGRSSSIKRSRWSPSNRPAVSAGSPRHRSPI